MKVLIISRVFWPDTVSVAQHVGDLAFALAKKGHEVKVLTSRYAYENPNEIYTDFEQKDGVEIVRIQHFAADKSSKIKRIIDYFLFNLLIFIKLFSIKKKSYDVMLGMTNPPLLSFIGVIIAKWKKIPFCYWTMDLQPELAIEVGYMKKGSLAANFLTFLGDYIFKKSEGIITLDRFMAEHIAKRGGKKENIHTLPVWSVVPSVFEGGRMENSFRLESDFGDKIVVMYSGNHAVVHPLDTVLASALQLQGDDRFLFVFIGGGVRKQDVTDFKAKHSLHNIIQLPYQPREKIHLSLSSADIHLVILGDGHVGYTHPNKIYGAMYVGRPILYIGPKESHVADIFKECEGNIAVAHGEEDVLTQKLLLFADTPEAQRMEVGKSNRNYSLSHFSTDILIQQHIDVMEKVGNHQS